MKKITKWYKKIENDKGEIKYVFNHISDGWEKSDFPNAYKDKYGNDYPNQLSWSKEIWSKQFKYINEDYQIVDILNYEEALDLASSQSTRWTTTLQNRFLTTEILRIEEENELGFITMINRSVRAILLKGELTFDSARKYNESFTEDEKKSIKFKIENDKDFFEREKFLNELFNLI